MKDPGKLLRLFRTLNLLAGSKRGYTVDELAEKLGVSRRTVYRDLLIYGQCGFEVVTHPITHRLRVSNPGETAEKIGFDVDEAHILEEALLVLPDGPVRSDLLNKVRSFGDCSHALGNYLNQQAGLHYRSLSRAIRERIQVVLIDYNAPSSQSIGNRLVEPYGFSASLDTLYAFEPSSKRNKTYKMVRIGQVRLERIPWQFAHLHEVPKTDAFGMPMGDSILEVHLHLGQLSSNLLREEQPAAALFLSPLLTTNSGGRVHELQLRVADYRGIGRFVLGLIDDIDVIGPPDFVKYLRKRIISLNK